MLKYVSIHKLILFVANLMMSMAMFSCSDGSSYKSIVKDMIGKRIEFPSELVYSIDNILVNLDLENSDYKIVTYIGEENCTLCEMNLYKWKKIIEELKSLNKENSLDFIMILGSSMNAEIKTAITNEKFPYPIVCDSLLKFSEANKLSDDKACNTFILDGDDKIAVVGSPVINPKIKKLYKDFIINSNCSLNNYSNLDFSVDTTLSLGLVNPHDTLVFQYLLANNDEKVRYISEINTSCGCMQVKPNSNVVLPNGNVVLDISIAFDSTVHNNYQQTIDVYYDGIEIPETIMVDGYINNP